MCILCFHVSYNSFLSDYFIWKRINEYYYHMYRQVGDTYMYILRIQHVILLTRIDFSMSALTRMGHVHVRLGTRSARDHCRTPLGTPRCCDQGACMDNLLGCDTSRGADVRRVFPYPTAISNYAHRSDRAPAILSRKTASTGQHLVAYVWIMYVAFVPIRVASNFPDGYGETRRPTNAVATKNWLLCDTDFYFPLVRARCFNS